MRWNYKKRRCIRRFALFPTKVYFKNLMKTEVIWLEFYYVIQDRCEGFWFTDTGVSRDTWLKWKKDA